MELVVLMEDTATDPRLKTELGLSIHIRTDHGMLLLDTGASTGFAHNADVLGIDLARVDRVLISHGHYDHTGGLKLFLERNPHAPVHISPEAGGDYYVSKTVAVPPPLLPLIRPVLGRRQWFSKYIGMDRILLTNFGNRFQFIRSVESVDEGVWGLPDIERIEPPAGGNRFLLETRKGKTGEDRFRHELVWVIREPDGLVVFTGCGHNGVLNMISMVRRHLGSDRIKAVVGGFHLRSNPRRQEMADTFSAMEALGRKLIETGVERVITGHCTGEQAFQVLKGVLGGRLEALRCGGRYWV